MSKNKIAQDLVVREYTKEIGGELVEVITGYYPEITKQFAIVLDQDWNGEEYSDAGWITINNGSVNIDWEQSWRVKPIYHKTPKGEVFVVDYEQK